MHDRYVRYWEMRKLCKALENYLLNFDMSRGIDGFGPIVVVRLHTRAISNVIDYYYVVTILEMFARMSRAAIRMFVSEISSEYLDEISNIDRSIANTRLLSYLVGIVVGFHGTEPSCTRWLKPLTDIELDTENKRTVEIGVDYIFKPTRSVKRFVKKIHFTKFYTLLNP